MTKVTVAEEALRLVQYAIRSGWTIRYLNATGAFEWHTPGDALIFLSQDLYHVPPAVVAALDRPIIPTT